MFKKYIINLILCVYCLFCVSVIYAGLSVPAFFSDKMVIQSGAKIPVWGKAEPGEKVTVSFMGQQRNTVTDNNGKWMIHLDSVKPGLSGKMIISADKEIVIDDIITGEVWLCSGQSNMQFTVRGSDNADEEIANANYPEIRLFTVKRWLSDKPQEDVFGYWEKCSPESIGGFSAVGYYFGRNIHRTQKTPVGLINSCWGGSSAEAWTPAETFSSDNELSSILEEWNSTYKDTGNKGFDMGWAGDGIDVKEWKKMKLPAYWEMKRLDIDGAVWFRKDIDIPESWEGKELTLSLGKIADFDETYFNNIKVGETSSKTRRGLCRNIERKYKIPAEIIKQGVNTIAVRVFNYCYMGGICGEKKSISVSPVSSEESIPLKGKWKYRIELELEPSGGIRGIWDMPTGMFNAMLSPLIPYAIKGVIWYQGESNAGLHSLSIMHAEVYRRLFPAMIGGWRKLWKQGDFPFLFVQLANFKGGIAELDHSPSGWAWVRESQLKTLAYPNTGMAVTIDIGDPDDIHPKNKQDVGKRLALIARAKVYGEDIIYSGPMYDSMEIKDDKVLLKFENTGEGLAVRDNGELKGFSIAGKNKRFKWAEAKIEDNFSVLVWNKKIKKPLYVRYGWAINPDCNLHNKEGLPASPFRTDELSE